MNRWPLRWQLAVLTTGLVAAVLLAVGLTACAHLYREGVNDLDRELRHVAREFYSTLSQKHEVDWTVRSTSHDLLPAAHYLYVAEVLDAHGRALFRSRNLGDTGLPALERNRPRMATLQLDGHLVRAGAFEQNGIELRLAMALHTVERARNDLVNAFLVATPVVLLIVAVGGWLIAHHVLAPVQEIAASAERINAERLDQRLPLSGSGGEIARLTVVLNHMFDRLEVSFRQATRFTSDASHELKTPLTIIRGELESAIRSGHFEPSQEKLLVNLMEETERLTQITDGLLLLSRADAGHFQLELKPVDLLGLVQDLLEDAEILAAPLHLRIEPELPPQAFVLGAPQFLRQVLLNLLDNAIKYNQPHGRVRLTLKADATDWVLHLGNTGAGIKPANAGHVFDRFFRGDESRSRTRAGHGLGLSICREIVRAHGGEIVLKISQHGWTEFCFHLPKAPAPDPPTGALMKMATPSSS